MFVASPCHDIRSQRPKYPNLARLVAACPTAFPMHAPTFDIDVHAYCEMSHPEPASAKDENTSFFLMDTPTAPVASRPSNGRIEHQVL